MRNGPLHPTQLHSSPSHINAVPQQVVPSLAVEYLRDLAPLGHELRIRRFLTGGEALSPSLATAAYKVRCAGSSDAQNGVQATSLPDIRWQGRLPSPRQRLPAPLARPHVCRQMCAGECARASSPAPPTPHRLLAVAHHPPPPPLVPQALPGCEMVWNTYGPTEVTVQVITGAIPRGADRVPLGRPDHNVHCYISSYVEDDEQDKKTAKRVSAAQQPWGGGRAAGRSRCASALERSQIRNS